MLVGMLPKDPLKALSFTWHQLKSYLLQSLTSRWTQSIIAPPAPHGSPRGDAALSPAGREHPGAPEEVQTDAGGAGRPVQDAGHGPMGGPGAGGLLTCSCQEAPAGDLRRAAPPGG